MKANYRPVFNLNRKILHKLLPLDTPMAFAIVSSQACNIHCTYCLHSLSSRVLRDKGFAQKNMDWDTFTHTVDLLKEFPKKIKSLNMSGQGEPLCNPHFADMVRYLHESDTVEDLNFITNGLLLTHTLSDALIDAGINRIFVSLQGMTGKKYQEICGKEIDFDALVENLRYFYEQKNKSPRKEDIQLNIKIADVALDTGDREKFLACLGDICDTIHVETIKPLYADVDYSDLLGKNNTDMTTTRFGRLHKKQKACYLAFYDMNVTPDGEIRPCGAPFQGCPGLGNIRNTSLVEAWNSDVRRKFLLSMLQGERYKNPVCCDCDYPNDVPTENDEIDPFVEDLIPKFIR